MLVLARKPGETIVMEYGGKIITVTVIGTTRGKVRLGIDAPDPVTIRRGEKTTQHTGDSHDCGTPER